MSKALSRGRCDRAFDVPLRHTRGTTGRAPGVDRVVVHARWSQRRVVTWAWAIAISSWRMAGVGAMSIARATAFRLRASTRRARSFAVKFIGVSSLSEFLSVGVPQVCTLQPANAPDYPVSWGTRRRFSGVYSKATHDSPDGHRPPPNSPTRLPSVTAREPQATGNQSSRPSRNRPKCGTVNAI